MADRDVVSNGWSHIRRAVRLAVAVSVIGALLVVPGKAHAVPLQDLFSGTSIVVGDKVFSDWKLLLLSAPQPVDFSQIDVVPLKDQPFNPGLRFNANGQLTVTGTDVLDFTFGFTVATQNGLPLIKDNSLELTGSTFGGDGGLIVIAEDVSGADSTLLGSKLVIADNLFNDFHLFDSAEFAPQSLLLVEKSILLAGDFDTDSISLDSFEQRFSQVPEPGTLFLVALGMGGMVLCRLGVTRKQLAKRVKEARP